jgi:hypothetical protein
MHIEIESRSSKISDQRLLLLAAKLRTVPRKRFDMGTFNGYGLFKEDACGTVACAAGWATTIPAFRKVGLRFGGAPDCALIVFRGHERNGGTYVALSAFFEIALDETFVLFSPDEGHETPKQVARNIERFVHQRQQASRA